MAYTDEDKRNHIREVQEFLRAVSFFDKRIPQIAVDGIFGPQTEEAVAAYQRARDLRVSGRVNRETWNFLATEYRIIRELQSSARPIDPFPSPSHVIRPGDVGSLVIILQVLLDEAGKQYANLPRVPVTGVYDERTGDAVRAFQKISKMEQTGEVDKATWDRLADAYNARISP